MSGIVIKLGSLVIKSLSKPVATYIKGQAREHPRFRQICIAGAQRVHRLDMRLRLGLLQDRAAIDKQIAREAAEAQAKKSKQEIPTVKTEAQSKADEASAAAEKAEKVKAADRAKSIPKPKIRPLSEAKAIDAGANFASETFLLTVGVGLIVFERWWASRRENTRREDVSDRIAELEESEKSARRALVELEKEILRLRVKAGADKSSKRILPKEVWDIEESEEEESRPRAKSWIGWFRRQASSNSQDPNEAEPPLSESQPSIPIDKIPPPKHPERNMAFWPFAPSSESYRCPQSTTGFQQQPLPQAQRQPFLLLTPVSVLSTEQDALRSRIERFSTLTTDPKPAIAFLLANHATQNSTINGFHAYMTLSTM
ncbi:MAG: hypothetical protein Q9219_004172 [cf. Caloplaca sp. 3 TL-2023]